MEELITKINAICMKNGSKLDLKSYEIQDALFNYNDIDWSPYSVNIDDSSECCYKRIKIYQNNFYDYSMYLISWKPNVSCKVHNHPENGCIFKVVKGKIKEIRYKPISSTLKSVSVKEISDKDKVSYIDDTIGFHKMENINDDLYSYSLHLYSPGNFKTKYFDDY